MKVHVFQYDAKGTCPGGLIEGIADFVRLKAGLAPPHWKPGPRSRWDEGYEGKHEAATLSHGLTHMML